MSLRSFALSGFMIMVSSDVQSFVPSGLERESQHPPSVEPIDLQHCFGLDSCATFANFVQKGSERL